MDRTTQKRSIGWLASRSWRIWLTAVPALYVASFVPALVTMRFMLKVGWINEGGQVIFGLLYYPLWWVAGY